MAPVSLQIVPSLEKVCLLILLSNLFCFFKKNTLTRLFLNMLIDEKVLGFSFNILKNFEIETFSWCY